jgi:hypothetical protein
MPDTNVESKIASVNYDNGTSNFKKVETRNSNIGNLGFLFVTMIIILCVVVFTQKAFIFNTITPAAVTNTPEVVTETETTYVETEKPSGNSDTSFIQTETTKTVTETEVD